MKRVLIAGLLGGLVAFAWGSVVWMNYPWEYTQIVILDTVCGSLLVGLVVAAVVRPEKKTAAWFR